MSSCAAAAKAHAPEPCSTTREATAMRSLLTATGESPSNTDDPAQPKKKSPGPSENPGSPGGSRVRSLRTALIFGGFNSLIGAAFYPIYFRSLMRLEECKKEQAINRAGIVQEDVQPPGLKVWSDPFGRK
ncbi:small integral membrane protein 20-like [Dama dama]|uniref:small integral membrane protein 20-like n=1 Tax=Dama dama TaxID=30532 RepID=UPI002A36726C|nr:small integral membrane protein 20-like [Dama dama]